jgi:hypothetical protein
MTSDQRHEVEKLLNQAGAVVFLMGAVKIQDAELVSNELGNAAWLVQDLIEQVIEVVVSTERETAA